jgi:hypothetical protein
MQKHWQLDLLLQDTPTEHCCALLAALTLLITTASPQLL